MSFQLLLRLAALLVALAAALGLLPQEHADLAAKVLHLVLQIILLLSNAA